jgi:hypothetical protein
MPRPDHVIEGLKKQIQDLRDEFEKFAKEHKAPLEVLRAWAWSQKWKVLTGIIAVIIAVGTGVYTGWVGSAINRAVDPRVAEQLKQPTKDLSTLHDDVTTLKATLETLKPLIDGLLLERFKNVVALPKSEFQNKLPEVQNLIALARQRGVTVDAALTRRMSERLLSIKPRVPDFWPASAQLVSYKSSNGAASNVLNLASAKLADCTESEPAPMRITAVLSPQQAQVSNALYENCQITLDSPKDDERINSFILGKFPRIKFKNCLVVYRGGQINLKLEWRGEVIGFQIEGKPPMAMKMSGETMEFENCLFQFTIQGVPPPTGQEVTAVLLAQNSDTLRLPRP